MAAGGYRLRLVFSRIDHIGVAVPELEPALALYRDQFELSLVHREVVSEQGVEAVLLDVGENHVELLAPLAEDTPVGKFLARNGPGVHHIGYGVVDVAEALAKIGESGVRLIDERPRHGSMGASIAFLHPKDTGGVLTELVQAAPPA